MWLRAATGTLQHNSNLQEAVQQAAEESDASQTTRVHRGEHVSVHTQVWHRVSKEVLQPDDPFELHQLLFEATYHAWQPAQQVGTLMRTPTHIAKPCSASWRANDLLRSSGASVGTVFVANKRLLSCNALPVPQLKLLVSECATASRDRRQRGCLQLTASRIQTWRPSCTVFRRAHRLRLCPGR